MTSSYSLELAADTIAEIRRVVRHELAAFGVREPDITVAHGEDHDGDPAIMVEVKYHRGPEAFDGRAAARALFRLNSMLHERGERRFAYIMHREEAGA